MNKQTQDKFIEIEDILRMNADEMQCQIFDNASAGEMVGEASVGEVSKPTVIVSAESSPKNI